MDLIERTRSGDGDAFAALFHQYKNLVYRTAYLITGSAADAEDVLQDVFLRVHDALGSYDPAKGAFTTWLYRVTVNLCLSRQRRARPTGTLYERTPGEASPEGQIAESLALEQALDGLSEKQRAVIFLRYYAGLSYAEIAGVLDVPLGTVQSRLNGALQSLRHNLIVHDESAAGKVPVGLPADKGVTR
jgi:RNA polymerase sigma-70 factor (ECF subfamily)